MMITSALDTPVFSAGGYRFTWAEVIDAARVRGDWATLQRHIVGLLARERDLSAAGALPTSADTRTAANDFRYQHKLLSADELEEWLARRDVSVDEWMAEMRRSLLEPADGDAKDSPEGLERISWVHAVCSGKLAQYARTLAEEVAVHLTEQPSAPPGEVLAALSRGREQFCAAQLREPALATEVRNNKIGWTRLDLQLLIHPDEMVVREAVMCIRLDGRELADVAVDAGAQLQDMSLLLDDAEPVLRTRLLAAAPGDLVGPLATGADHRLGRVLRRIAPSLDDPAVRRRAEETVINRALAAAVNRHVNWHEYLDPPPAPSAPAELRRIALLELMPSYVRRLVEASFSRVSFGFGEVIVTEGDAADALYVIESGTARVVKTGDHGEEVPLNVLHAGDALGERALMNPGGRRTATVRASSPVQALRLERAVFDALVRSEPQVAHYVDLHVRRHELRDFLRAYTAFADLPPEGMRLLLEGLEPRSVSAAEMVIRQGEPSGPMYIVRNGRLRAYIDRNGNREQRAYLRQGDFFGEVSLLRGSNRTANVEAVSDGQLWALAPELFTQLVAEHPKFRERIEQRVSSYDYRRVARVPLDFAEELLPADGAGPEVLSEEQTQTAAVEYPQLTEGEEGDGDLDGFGRPQRRIRRFPQVLQVDEMDCGAASLAIICRYLGRNVSISRVRDAVHTAIDGTSLLGIARGAESIGLEVRTAKVSKSRLDAMPLPAIVHWENNHWLVLYDIDAEHARVSDPARGRRRLKRSEFESKWSGFAAFFATTEAFEQAPEESSRVGWLLEFFKPYRRVLVLALVLAFLAAGLEMLLPVLTRYIVDGVIPNHDSSLLTVLVVAMFGGFLLMVLVALVQRFFLSRIAVRIDRASLDTLSEKLLALPMSYFNARRTGDISRRINGMRLVRQFIVEHGVAGLAAATQLLVAVVLMFVFSWRLTLVYLLTVPLYGGLMWFSRTRLRPTFDVLEESWGKYQSRQIDSIKGIETVKAVGAEESLRRLLLGQFNDLSNRLFRADLTMMVYQASIQMVSLLSLALFLWIGAVEVLHDQLTIGELVAFNALVLLANGPVLGLLGLWDQLQYSSILLGRLNDILEQEPEQGADHSMLTPVKSVSGHVRFQRMTFAYPGPATTPVLDEIDFEIQPGTRAAIVGRSGSGKTTLVKCLSGLLEPTSGAILFDGADITGLNLRQLRRHIGFVLQDNYMFDATIAENIAFGEERADRERVMWAARLANAAEFIERLPLGYETKIGETGLLLSGGQRQRIAIARAVYPRPPVLVFDEATSALDTESERAVKENLDQLLAGRTSFVIAHRLSTVRDADIILVLEKGRLVEHGTHDELMARQGLYYYLCSQQLAL